MIVRKLNAVQYEVVLDSTQLLQQFEFLTTAKRYRYWNKTWEYFKTNAFYYDEVNYNKIVIKAGFLPYLYDNYKDILTEKSKELILSEIQSTSVPYFDNLTKEQNAELAVLTSQTRGINSKYTGSGKTEVIATLADYCVRNNEKCIIIAPTNKACDEIRDRILNKFSHDTNFYYNSDSCINVFCAIGFFRSNEFQIEDPFWKEVKWVIADEVEKDINNDVEDCFFELDNCRHWYGFSATADKKEGLPITTKLQNPTIGRNLKIVKYFGFTTVYKKPELKYIDLVEIEVKRFWQILGNERKIYDNDGYRDRELEGDFNSGFIPYVDTYFDEELAKVIKRICLRIGQMFVPLSRREVLTDWLQNYWTEIPVIFINGSGYQYWLNGEVQKLLTLQDVKNMILSKEVRFVFGTVSAFNSLDLIGMQNVMLLAYSSASMVLQSIGRVSRSNMYRIFLPGYLGTDRNAFQTDYQRRLNLILSYYSECKINRIRKTDSDYDVIGNQTKYYSKAT